MKLTGLIEENISDEQFDIEALRDEIGISRSQLHRKLKALTGETSSEFIRNVRLRKGRTLLKEGAGNVSEVGYMVGFNTQTYFTSSYTKLFGVSPSKDLEGKTTQNS